MIQTTRGLPNSCSSCGTQIDPAVGWFAENEDVARGGGGLCVNCAPHVPSGQGNLATAETSSLAPKPAPEPDANIVTFDALRNAEGEFVSPRDQDVDGKPEKIVHKKRKPKRKAK